ncbi:MAG: NAD(+) synthase [Pseudomonadota bacterium]
MNKLSYAVLDIDAAAEAEKICAGLREALRTRLHRRGFVVALSGGVDSSVTAALCVQAVGKERVHGLLLPERDSSGSSLELGRTLAEQLGIAYHVQDIAPTLDAIGCYQWRDEAIRRVFPEYQANWKSKIALAGGNEGRLNYFNLVVQSPQGEIKQARLGLNEYLQIVAATSYKQRIRKTVEYFHADRLNYAVAGTPNRLEYDQGFFVKNGDGSADIKPIAHLYKTQVYALARHFGLPERICAAMPTTDTYSMAQGQDEFYFVLPYREMDLSLWAYNHNIPAAQLAESLGLSVERAQFIYQDIEKKRRTTAYLHTSALLVEDVALGASA